MRALTSVTEPPAAARCLLSTIAGAYGLVAGEQIAGTPWHASIQAPPVGTEHLLIVALHGDSEAATALGQLGVTTTTANVVRRRIERDAGWSHDDAGPQPPDNALDHFVARWATGRGLFGRRKRAGWRKASFTPAARRALRVAIDEAALDGSTGGPMEVRCEHLLTGLLADPTNRATELLAALGVPRGVAVAASNGAVAPQPVGDTELDADLRFTRAVLLGHTTYTAPTARQRLGLAAVRSFHANWAEHPWAWAVLDAQEHARRLGETDLGTEHVLLGIAATHEIAHAHPYLLPPDAHRWYTGGEALAEAGVTHRALKHALADTVGRTARRAGLDPADVAALRSTGIDVDEIVAHAERTFGPGAPTTRHGDRRSRAARDAKSWRPDAAVAPENRSTGTLLAAALDSEHTGAWRLLRAAGADPARVLRRIG